MDRSEYNYTVCLLVLHTTSQSPQLWGLLLHSHFCQMTSLLLEKHAEPSLGSRPDSISQTTTVSGNSHSPFQSHGNENKERITLRKKKKFFYRLYSEFSWCLCEPRRHLLAGALFFCCPKCNLELSQLTYMSTTSFSSTQTGQTWVWEPLGMTLSWMQCWPSYSPHFSRRQWQGPTPSGWSGKEMTPLFFLCSVPMSTLGDSSCSHPLGKYASEQAQTSPSFLMWESCMAAWDHRGRRWASLVIRARLCLLVSATVSLLQPVTTQGKIKSQSLEIKLKFPNLESSDLTISLHFFSKWNQRNDERVMKK